MNETKDEPREGSMTPPDLREMRERLARYIAGIPDDPEFASLPPSIGAQNSAKAALEAAGVPTLLAGTQSKDERIAELEGALREIIERGTHTAMGNLHYPDGFIDIARAALAGTGVASDGGGAVGSDDPHYDPGGSLG